MLNWMISKCKKWIIGVVVICILIFVLIYLIFFRDTSILVDENSARSDWLIFIGSYLSFIGSIAVAGVSLAQSSYHNEMETKRRAYERHKQIQPLFAVEIISIDKKICKTNEGISLIDSSMGFKHKNVVLEIQVVNNSPAKNVFIFEDCYIGSCIKPGDKKQICVAYYNSSDAKYEHVVKLLDDYERDDEWLPKWFNIYYEDVDGRAMVQTFNLNPNMGTKYYQLEEEPWEL